MSIQRVFRQIERSTVATYPGVTDPRKPPSVRTTFLIGWAPYGEKGLPEYGAGMPNATHLPALRRSSSQRAVGPTPRSQTVRRAQFLIQSHTWSEVLRIENTGVTSSRYPRKVNALVFQLDSVLWFYTPTDGTQSLSLFRTPGDAESDKQQPWAPAGRDRRGIHRVGGDAPRRSEPLPGGPRLPNGCFIESMAILFDRLAHGARIPENPKLLSYYVALPGGIRGHTVLQFTSAGRVQVIDPDRPSSPRRIRYSDENNATSVPPCGSAAT